jgi:hypothetical protein
MKGFAFKMCSDIFSALLENKNSENTDQVVSEPEEMFGGLQQSEIDELVNTTYKGIKADINGNYLEYWYKSNSGKNDNMARFKIDAAGYLVKYLGPYSTAVSPRVFGEKLEENIK